MTMNGASALIHALEDLGVAQVFGLPGVQNIDIYDALLSSRIHHVLVRHEQAAVHMADGYARSSGQVGVVLATSGPGATNTVTGIATAYMDSVPLVVITGQVSTASIGTDAFQEADITTVTLPITKHSYLIKDVNELVPAVFEAFYLATSGRPGPVLIDIPCNVAAATTLYQPPTAQPALASYKPTIRGNVRQIKSALGFIRNASRPVFLAGGGVVRSHAEHEIVSLAEAWEIPVVTTLMAKGVIAPDHHLCLGQCGVYGAPLANAALQEADVLIAVGTRFSERATGNAMEYAPRATVIHIDIDPAEIGKNVRADIPIVGDAAAVLQEMSKRLSAEELPRDTMRAKRDDSATLEQGSSGRDELYQNTTHRVFSVLNKLLGTCDDVIVTTDVGQHQLWASHLIAVDTPRRFLTSGGLGTMGYGLPAALGAQVACPQSLVLCVSGDGSFQMNLQEMATATAQSLPVKIIILNNHSYGLVRQWQELFLDHRYAHTLLDDVPDYVMLAHAYGWQGRRTDTKADACDLEGDLLWLLESTTPALLDIIVPTEDLLEPMVMPGGTLTELV